MNISSNYIKNIAVCIGFGSLILSGSTWYAADDKAKNTDSIIVSSRRGGIDLLSVNVVGEIASLFKMDEELCCGNSVAIAMNKLGERYILSIASEKGFAVYQLTELESEAIRAFQADLLIKKRSTTFLPEGTEKCSCRTGTLSKTSELVFVVMYICNNGAAVRFRMTFKKNEVGEILVADHVNDTLCLKEDARDESSASDGN